MIISMIYYPSTGYHIMWGLRWVRHFCISWFPAMCIQAKHSDLCIGIASKIYSLMSDCCLSSILVPTADWRDLYASPGSSLGCWWLGIRRRFSHPREMRCPFSALQGPQLVQSDTIVSRPCRRLGTGSHRESPLRSLLWVGVSEHWQTIVALHMRPAEGQYQGTSALVWTACPVTDASAQIPQGNSAHFALFIWWISFQRTSHLPKSLWKKKCHAADNFGRDCG